MLKVLCQFLVILTIFGSTKCALRSLPPYIEACRQNDPEINKCVIENGNKAIPKLKNGDKYFKIPSTNPLKINEAVLEPGSSLKLTMKNIDAFGLDKIKILDADCRLKDNLLKLTLDLPEIQLIGDYTIEGRLVILPITGKGRVNITATGLNVKYTLKFKKENKSGIDRIKVEDNDVEYDSKRIYYDFDNLFNGDTQLGNQMKIFLNENWEEIDKEFHDSFRDVIAAILRTLIVQIVKDIPFDKVFLP